MCPAPTLSFMSICRVNNRAKRKMDRKVAVGVDKSASNYSRIRHHY